MTPDPPRESDTRDYDQKRRDAQYEIDEKLRQQKEGQHETHSTPAPNPGRRGH